MKLASILVGLLCSCVAPLSEGRNALVAPERAWIEPAVLALLGARQRTITIGYADGMMGCVAYSRGNAITLGPQAFTSSEELRLTLAHELAHVYMGSYESLPFAVQEGIAIRVSILVCRRNEIYPEPSPALLQRVLSMGRSEYFAIRNASERDAVDAASTWVAERLLP
jgi:hypothetical protein